jgi:hypothetical protein
MLIRRITNRKAPRKFISLLLFYWYSSRMTGFCIIRRILCFIISINAICLFVTKRFSIYIFIYKVFNWITINRAILILFLVLIRLWSLSIKEISHSVRPMLLLKSSLSVSIESRIMVSHQFPLCVVHLLVNCGVVFVRVTRTLVMVLERMA